MAVPRTNGAPSKGAPALRPLADPESIGTPAGTKEAIFCQECRQGVIAVMLEGLGAFKGAHGFDAVAIPTNCWPELDRPRHIGLDASAVHILLE